MKRFAEFLGIIAIGGFAAAGCGDETTDTNGTTTSTGQGAGGAGSGGAGGSGGADGSGGTSAGGMATGGSGGQGGSVAGCGNGIIEDGEGCDDGNMSNSDSCPDDAANGGTCQPASCTDGFRWDSDGGDETDVDCGGSVCLACPGALVINEYAVAPTDAEFIEIYNPLDVPVTLEHVYLADYADYFMVAQGMGGPGATDFRVSFPTGSSIAAKQYLTIGLHSAAAFNTTYAASPDYDFDAADPGAPAVEGEIGATAELSDGGEMAVLFFWDGHSDLVRDLDYALWGGQVEAMNKSGIVAGASTYLNDTDNAAQAVQTPPVATETASRCYLDEGLETQTAGNGFSGADEASENQHQTYQVTVNPTPGAENNCVLLVVRVGGQGGLVELFSADFSLSTQTAVTTDLAAFQGANGLARNPLDWQLYIVHSEDGSSPEDRHLGVLDAATATITTIGPLSDAIAAMKFASDGTLYGVSGNINAGSKGTLYTIDLATGALTNVATLGNGDDGEAFAFNPNDGLMYHYSGYSGGAAIFESIELVNYGVTGIAQNMTINGEVAAAMWDAYDDGLVVLTTAGDVYSLDTSGTNVDTGSDYPGSTIQGLVLR